MATDYYLQREGIKGESTDSKHMGESLGLKFSKVYWKYTQQKICGGTSGNTAGGWDLVTHRIA